MLITAEATFICEIISYLMQIALFKMPIQILAFIKIIVIELLYNLLIIIIIYPLIEKTGEILTRIFKEKNILTRYY